MRPVALRQEIQSALKIVCPPWAGRGDNHTGNKSTFASADKVTIDFNARLMQQSVWMERQSVNEFG
jgi:hypothetical protein